MPTYQRRFCQPSELEHELRDITERHEEQSKGMEALQARVAELEHELHHVTERFDTQSKEMEDLVVCLADADMAAKDLKKRLKDLGETVSDDEGQ